MKPIKIQDTETLQAELAVVQKRCRERTITAEDIIDACESVAYELNIPKKHMVGVRINVDLCAQHFPSAYRYSPESTQFVAEYKKSGWVIINIYRGWCGAPSKRFICHHTEESRQALLARFNSWG